MQWALLVTVALLFAGRSEAADCYWKGYPFCGLLRVGVLGCGDDYFMRYGFNLLCTISPDKLCCPSGPNHDIVLCEHRDFGGDCIAETVRPGDCVKLSRNDWASSAWSPGQGCFRLYEHANCEGRSAAVIPGEQINIFSSTLNDLFTSVSLCNHDDTCQPGEPTSSRRRRSAAGDDKPPPHQCNTNTTGRGDDRTCRGEDTTDLSEDTTGRGKDTTDRSENTTGRGEDAKSDVSDVLMVDPQSPPRRRLRRSGDDFTCTWFNNVWTVGFLAWLLRDTRHLQGPVRYYQVGPYGRTETMEALIESVHLYTGTPTNEQARRYARNMGQDTDDAGHVLASRLGGSGTDLRNIFPQALDMNRGAWAQVEGMVADVVHNYGSALFTVNLLYDNQQATRPRRIVYRIMAGDPLRVIHIDDLLNPLTLRWATGNWTF